MVLTLKAPVFIFAASSFIKVNRLASQQHMNMAVLIFMRLNRGWLLKLLYYLPVLTHTDTPILQFKSLSSPHYVRFHWISSRKEQKLRHVPLFRGVRIRYIWKAQSARDHQLKRDLSLNKQKVAHFHWKTGNSTP